MPQWKTISQRNFLKGLQATYGLFSQPAAILVRLSNLLYDKRGALRTTDGSFGFTRNAVAQPFYGPITDITLYLPPSVNAYYVGIQRSGATQQGLPSGLTGTPITIGGTIATATRTGSVVTLRTTAAHNLVALAPDNGLPFNPGNLQVTGTGTDFDGDIPYNQISIINATTISYPQAGINGETISTGTLGTHLANGGRHFTVTACDGSGGETPGQAAGPILVATSGAQNAILFSWTAGQYNSLFSLYEEIGTSWSRITPGSGATQTIPGTSFVFFDPTVGSGSSAPPAANTTQTCAIYRMDAPTYMVQLGVVPPYIVPLIGGIPGASGQPGAASGAGPTPEGGVPGGVSPLPQMAQFTGRLVLALGNGYPLQQYTDPSIDATGFQTVTNSFSSQYPDWQASVAWNQGDQIKDSVSGGVFQALQTGSSGTARPTFVNVLNATTSETTGTLIWKCIATKITPTALRGAAHAIVYAGSLWIANTWPTTTSDLLDGPNVLKMSDVNNLSSWNPLNIAFIAKDDGDQITGLATFTIAESGISPTGSLVLFKTFSTYQITGVFGASDFAIQQAQTDLGCVAPRSIAFVPGFGIMRMTHLGFAYFNGVGDKLASEEIRPYLFGGQSDIQPVDWNFMYFAKAAQSANPPMYVCAVPVLANVLTGVTVTPQTAGASVLYARVSQLTLENGAWVETSISAEQTISGANQLVLATTPAAQTNVRYRVYLGLTPGGENAYAQAASFNNTLLNYATMTAGAPSIGNGQLQRLICYDLVQRTWTILDLPFQISTLKQVRAAGTIPLTIAGGYSDSVVRRLFAGDIAWDSGGAVMWSFRGAEVFQEGGSGKVFYRRVILRGQQTANTSIQVSIALSGNTQAAVTAQQNNLGTNQWRFTIDIMQDALNANATVSGSGPISIDSLDWQVKPKPVGAPVSIQK